MAGRVEPGLADRAEPTPIRLEGNRVLSKGVARVLDGQFPVPDLDRLFRLRATRLLKDGGSLRFRHWRLYGERGLAGERAAVWLDGETLTLEYATETLAQYRVAFEPDGHRLKEVAEPRLFATAHTSPQPFLPGLAELDWRPAQRLAPYRPRRQRRGEGTQGRLVVSEPEAATGYSVPDGDALGQGFVRAGGSRR